MLQVRAQALDQLMSCRRLLRMSRRPGPVPGDLERTSGGNLAAGHTPSIITSPGGHGCPSTEIRLGARAHLVPFDRRSP